MQDGVVQDVIFFGLLIVPRGIEIPRGDTHGADERNF